MRSAERAAPREIESDERSAGRGGRPATGTSDVHVVVGRHSTPKNAKNAQKDIKCAVTKAKLWNNALVCAPCERDTALERIPRVGTSVPLGRESKAGRL